MLSLQSIISPLRKPRRGGIKDRKVGNLKRKDLDNIRKKNSLSSFCPCDHPTILSTHSNPLTTGVVRIYFDLYENITYAYMNCLLKKYSEERSEQTESTAKTDGWTKSFVCRSRPAAKIPLFSTHRSITLEQPWCVAKKK